MELEQGMNQLDKFALMNIETNHPVLISIKGNRSLSYSDVALLRARRKKALKTLGIPSRTEVIKLPCGVGFGGYAQLTIADGEFITHIKFRTEDGHYEWDEQLDSYHLREPNSSDPFVLFDNHGLMEYVGGHRVNYNGKIGTNISKWNERIFLDQDKVIQAINSGTFKQLVPWGTIVYPFALKFRGGDMHLSDLNSMSMLLFILSKFGFWNMATLHMLDDSQTLDQLLDLDNGSNHIELLIEGLETGSDILNHDLGPFLQPIIIAADITGNISKVYIMKQIVDQAKQTFSDKMVEAKLNSKLTEYIHLETGEVSRLSSYAKEYIKQWVSDGLVFDKVIDPNI